MLANKICMILNNLTELPFGKSSFVKENKYSMYRGIVFFVCACICGRTTPILESHCNRTTHQHQLFICKEKQTEILFSSSFLINLHFWMRSAFHIVAQLRDILMFECCDSFNESKFFVNNLSERANEKKKMKAGKVRAMRMTKESKKQLTHSYITYIELRRCRCCRRRRRRQSKINTKR